MDAVYENIVLIYVNMPSFVGSNIWSTESQKMLQKLLEARDKR